MTFVSPLKLASIISVGLGVGVILPTANQPTLDLESGRQDTIRIAQLVESINYPDATGRIKYIVGWLDSNSTTPCGDDYDCDGD